MPKRTVSLRLDEDTIEAVRELAAGREWTPSHFMARAIERVVEGEKAKTGSGSRPRPASRAAR